MADLKLGRLLDDLPSSLPEELTEVLAQSPHVRIERIVSTGHASPEDFWYDQDEAEWVIVLKGQANLLLEGDDEPLTMRPGDHILIPPHRKHRVQWTTPDSPTIWLAVFFHDSFAPVAHLKNSTNEQRSQLK